MSWSYDRVPSGAEFASSHLQNTSDDDVGPFKSSDIRVASREGGFTIAENAHHEVYTLPVHKKRPIASRAQPSTNDVLPSDRIKSDKRKLLDDQDREGSPSKKSTLQHRSIPETLDTIKASSKEEMEIHGDAQTAIHDPTASFTTATDLKPDAQQRPLSFHNTKISPNVGNPGSPRSPTTRTLLQLEEHSSDDNDEDRGVFHPSAAELDSSEHRTIEQYSEFAADADLGPVTLKLTPKDYAITPEQLRAEIDHLLSKVNALEAKCREVIAAETGDLVRSQASLKVRTVEKQPAPKSPAAVRGQSTSKGQPQPEPLRPDPKQDHYFRILIGLHRQLCQEYYDLLRASQYASSLKPVPAELKDYSGRASIPGRLWRHGVHSLLELLRKCLPTSQEYLHAYVVLAYQLFALCVETVEDHKDAWYECLGDLARYRMAVEYENGKDREQWHDIADRWYAKGSMSKPSVGRLIHHRAILARRTGVWPQLLLYSRSLMVSEAFHIARASMKSTVFANATTPAFKSNIDAHPSDLKIQVVDSFVRMHALYMDDSARDVQGAWTIFAAKLIPYVTSIKSDFSAQGEAMAFANVAALFDWNKGKAHLTTLFSADYSPTIDEARKLASEFKITRFPMFYKVFCTYLLLLRMIGNESCYAHIHIITSFLYSLASAPCGFGVLYFGAEDVPWREMARAFNSMSRSEGIDFVKLQRDLQTGQIPHETPTERQMLPEDKNIRGLTWSYLPEKFFENFPLPEEEIQVERATNAGIRVERIIWLAMKLAQVGLGDGNEREVEMMKDKKWMRFDPLSKSFVVTLNGEALPDVPQKTTGQAA